MGWPFWPPSPPLELVPPPGSPSFGGGFEALGNGGNPMGLGKFFPAPFSGRRPVAAYPSPLGAARPSSSKARGRRAPS